MTMNTIRSLCLYASFAAAPFATQGCAVQTGEPDPQGPAVEQTDQQLDSIDSCPSSIEGQIRGAAVYLVNHWDDFEDWADDRYGVNPSSCLRNKLDGGTVRCTTSGNCTDPNVAGYAIPGGSTAYFCRTYTSGIYARYPSDTNRRTICFGALMAHEMSHTCLGDERLAEEIEDAARSFLAEHFGVRMTPSDCNSD
jgi:hypothetical protein